MTERSPAALVRAYYVAIDDGDYERLAGLLAPDFVQVRGDRTVEGRESFVEFMRDGRPETGTDHVVDAIYEGDGEVAARGRLFGPDGEVWFGFVDVFRVADGRLARLTTYSNGRVR